MDHSGVNISSEKSQKGEIKMICKNRLCRHHRSEQSLDCINEDDIILSDEGVCLLQESSDK